MILILSTSFCQMRSLRRILTNNVHPICWGLPSIKSLASTSQVDLWLIRVIALYYLSHSYNDRNFMQFLLIKEWTSTSHCFNEHFSKQAYRKMDRLFFQGRIAIGTFPSVVKKLDQNLARPRAIDSETKGLRFASKTHKISCFHSRLTLQGDSFWSSHGFVYDPDSPLFLSMMVEYQRHRKTTKHPTTPHCQHRAAFVQIGLARTCFHQLLSNCYTLDSGHVIQKI